MRVRISVRIGTLPTWEGSRSNRAATGLYSNTPTLHYSDEPLPRIRGRGRVRERSNP
jgi:hypothetical protein